MRQAKDLQKALRVLASNKKTVVCDERRETGEIIAAGKSSLRIS